MARSVSITHLNLYLRPCRRDLERKAHPSVSSSINASRTKYTDLHGTTRQEPIKATTSSFDAHEHGLNFDRMLITTNKNSTLHKSPAHARRMNDRSERHQNNHIDVSLSVSH